MTDATIQLPNDQGAAAAEAVKASMVTFDASQLRLLADESRVVVVNWHRQKGKDFTAAAKAVRHAIGTGQEWFIVSLTQRQADATFAKCRRFAKAYAAALKLVGPAVETAYDFDAYDKSIDQAFTFTARQITLPNGGRVTALPGRDPDTLAGLAGNIIFTEFGLFPNGGYNHWSVIFPITTRGYQVVIISTPRGRNTKFYELWNDPDTYSVHTCDIHRSVEREGFVLRDNAGRPCTIEAFRRLYNDEGKWPREYLCQFTGDLEALVKWAQLEEAAALSEGLDFSFLRMERAEGFDARFFGRLPPRGGRLEVGWDVARRGDLSVVWVNHSVPNRPSHLRYLVLMQDCKFAVQRLVIASAMDAGGGYSVGCGDSTGLGMDSNEAMEHQYRDRWEGVNFAGTRKRELASSLATAFVDRQQTIPTLAGPHKFVATDVYAIQKDETGGQLALDETDNPLLPESHCDVAWAGALARKARAKAPVRFVPPPRRQKPVGW